MAALGHHLHIEQWPLGRIEYAVGTVCAQCVEAGVALADHEGGHLWEDARLARVIEHRAQHFVAPDQAPEGVLQARQVEVFDLVFAVEVAAHAAQHQARVTA